MKRCAMVALATMLVFSSAITAQNKATKRIVKGEMKELVKNENTTINSDKRAEKMATELGLTDSQKADLKALFEKQDAKRVQEMENIKKLREEMKAKAEGERKANDLALAKILGQEKFHKFELLQAERRGEMKGRMLGRMNGRMNERDSQFRGGRGFAQGGPAQRGFAQGGPAQGGFAQRGPNQRGLVQRGPGQRELAFGGNGSRGFAPQGNLRGDKNLKRDSIQGPAQRGFAPRGFAPKQQGAEVK